MTGISYDVLKDASEAHGIKKSVKIISSAIYLVLNVVIRGAAGADKNPAASVAFNSGWPYQELCNYGDNKRDAG